MLHNGVGVRLEGFHGRYEAGIIDKVLRPGILLQFAKEVGGAEHVGHRALGTIHALGLAKTTTVK